MKLYADLLHNVRARRGLGDALLLLGLVVLGAGVAVELTLRERIDSAQRLTAETLRKRESAAERANDPATADMQARAANRALRDEYRRTFPLNEVFKALEAIKGGIVRDVAVNVDAGSVRLELSADSGESVATAVRSLQDALPDFRVALRRQAVDEKRVTGTIEVQDLRAMDAERK